MKPNSPGYARKAIAERTIPYRPHFTKLTGKVTAAILLQQIVYYWEEVVERRPFYKFRKPCKHDLYREGDSWVEELGFTPSEFDAAIRTIGTKIRKGISKAEALAGRAGREIKNLVIYWTDSNRVTWYELNQALFDEMTDPLYADRANSEKLNYLEIGPQDANSEKLNYLENCDPETTGKIRKVELPISYNTTNNTSDNTSGRKPKNESGKSEFGHQVPEKSPLSPIPEPPAPVKEPPGTVEPWRGPPPAAARVYRSRMNRWPRRTQYRRLHEVVGDEPGDLEFWGRVVSEYDALGWNPMNLAGMLEWFERREIPHVQRGGNSGHRTNEDIIAEWGALVGERQEDGGGAWVHVGGVEIQMEGESL